MNEINKEKLTVLFDKIKRDKKVLLIVITGFLGIIMIFFSEILPEEKKDSVETDNKSHFSEYAYKEELEQIIGKIDGVGNVEVMLTYEGTVESVYAKDTSKQIKSEDAKTDEEHIIIDKGSEEDGLLLKEIYPRVIGVAVVCEGGDNPTVKNEITQMLKALFDIGSNSISISEMNG